MNSFKGSQRCVLELLREPSFLVEINNLIKSTDANVDISDKWKPINLTYYKEAELRDFLSSQFNQKIGYDIANWWLAVKSSNSRTPNWDLISTCTINNQKGILLVEAKAHVKELEDESKGKSLAKDASENSKLNHTKIEEAISIANDGINESGFVVSISRDNCYQLSNRIAHSWWLANQGIPVVLLYLGFLNVKDMNDGKYKIFKTDTDWQTCFLNHAKQVGVDTLLNQKVECGQGSFITICKSILEK